MVKYLDSFIKCTLINCIDNAIKNTYDFINNINKINIVSECKMASLDIKIFYISIPKLKALIIPKNKLKYNNNFNNNGIKRFINIIN